jgi:hypothetical protein
MPEHIYIATGMRLPGDNSSAMSNSYRTSLETWFPGTNTTYTGLEGYATGRFFIEVLKETMREFGTITRELALQTVFEEHPLWAIEDVTFGPFEPGDESTTEPSGCNQGLRTTYLVHVRHSGVLEYVSKQPWHHGGCGDAIELHKKTSSRLLVYVIPSTLAGISVLLPVLVFFIGRSRRRRTGWTSEYVPVSRKMSRIRSDTSDGGVSDSDSAAAAAARKTGEPFHVAVSWDILTTTHNIPTVPANDLHGFRLVGSGSSARVYRAYWRGTVVAVKQMHNAVELDLASTIVQDLASEIKLWSQLKHPHIVQFLGVTPELWLVIEFMERGSLKSLMK